MIYIIKKDGTKEPFDVQKVIRAVSKSAARVMVTFDEKQIAQICKTVNRLVKKQGSEAISVETMHYIAETTLDELAPQVAKSYRDYRNYKQDFVTLLDKVYQKSQAIRYLGDTNNANTDSALVPTQRSLIYNELNGELYKKFFLNRAELEAMKAGYIYIHDRSARLDTINCCLFDMAKVLSDGFEMGNVWYNEPKTLDVAFDVMSDVAISAAACQYGGFTMPRVDSILAPYAEKSYQNYLQEYQQISGDFGIENIIPDYLADRWATEKVRRDMEQGFQSWEYRFNTVGSSRGDYPFIAVSFGIDTSRWGQMLTETILKVRAGGQGAAGKKKPVLFPKLTFLYDENLHGEGKKLEWLFDQAIECSSKSMYPDVLSLTGEGYIPSVYKKYGAVISLMGCRASLSPWYERGGMEPADEYDQPVFEGRFNMGAVSLHLPMILAKARQENQDFFQVLDYYLELIRSLHQRTFAYLGEKKASTNPLGYCQGGFYKGTLHPEEKIRPLLAPMTMSFGITALNELQELYNQKSLVEDGAFALQVMEYINKKVGEFKREDKILYAIYATPAESLCFVGDTEVQTYLGYKKMKDMAAGDLVYSFNEGERKVELKRVVEARLTQTKAKVVRVTFTNGQEEICTPNHPFGVRKISRDPVTGRVLGPETVMYVPALNLTPGDRIKSNYISLNQAGRPTSSIYFNGRKQLIQDINAEFAFGEKPHGNVTHHKDRDKTNNNFSNLCYMADHEHRRLHVQDNIKSYQHRAKSQIGERNTFYGKSHSLKAKMLNRQKHLGKAVEKFDLDYRKTGYFECATDAERAGYTRHLVKLACEGRRTGNINPHYYKNSYWRYANESDMAAEQNHCVESVELLDERHDVYNIEVEGNHNYFVGGADGILVHNCGLQVEQFRKQYGILKGVSDREYVSNSFHCGVWEDITPIEKQNLEGRFWDLFNGGKIQYCRYPLNYNKKAIKTLVRRAMDKGFYEGVNLSLAYCEDCGYEQLEMDSCPKCGSTNVTKIDRMNGYLGYTRVHGKTRFNQAKNLEIAERVSM